MGWVTATLYWVEMDVSGGYCIYLKKIGGTGLEMGVYYIIFQQCIKPLYYKIYRFIVCYET